MICDRRAGWLGLPRGRCKVKDANPRPRNYPLALSSPRPNDDYSAPMADARAGRKRARPGGHQLRPEVLAHHLRERILAGAARAIAERGYRQTTVADIVRAAAIARARFYENFSSKQDCFLVLYDGAVEDSIGVVSEACEAERGDFPSASAPGSRR